MKLDHTFIAIRERGMLEIMDLSLHVVRQHFLTLLLLLLIGAAPWMVIDWWLTHWLVTGIFSSDYAGYYYWLMALLVISQYQMGTALITYYLGQAMFVGRLGIRETVAGAWRTSPYFFWCHGGIRLVYPILFLTWLTYHCDEDTLIALSVFFIPALVLGAMLIRALRPFVSEMLLLEKTPISTKNPDKVNFKRRSQSLHGAASTELFGRFLLTCVLYTLLMYTFFSMFVSFDSTLNLQANSDFSFSAFYWIFSLWLVAGFAAVVRFLSYIDIRIRQEGWAVELKMRAEGQRLNPAIET